MSEEINLDYLKHLIPSGLNDIIRLNKDLLEIQYVNSYDLSQLEMSFPITNLKGVLKKGFLYKFVGLKPIRVEAIFMVGVRLHSEVTSSVNTSHVIGYDSSQGVILTESGSHYVVNELSIDAPDDLTLIHICNRLNQLIDGDFFGIPKFNFRVR